MWSCQHLSATYRAVSPVTCAVLAMASMFTLSSLIFIFYPVARLLTISSKTSFSSSVSPSISISSANWSISMLSYWILIPTLCCSFSLTFSNGFWMYILNSIGDREQPALYPAGCMACAYHISQLPFPLYTDFRYIFYPYSLLPFPPTYKTNDTT